MVFLILFFLELISLFFLSKRLTNLVYGLFFRLTKNKKSAGYLLALLFFPGTFIHEMSHALSALFLLVPFGEIELLPRIEDNGIKMGSIGIAKTDLVRRFLVGIAPFVVGTTLILLIVYLLSMNRFIDSWWGSLFAGFVIFEIGNMMFASKKDLEGAYILFLFIFILFIIGSLLGIQFPFLSLDVLSTTAFFNIVEKACLYLLVPVGIDLGLILALKMI